MYRNFAMGVEIFNFFTDARLEFEVEIFERIYFKIKTYDAIVSYNIFVNFFHFLIDKLILQIEARLKMIYIYLHVIKKSDWFDFFFL